MEEPTALTAAELGISETEYERILQGLQQRQADEPAGDSAMRGSPSSGSVSFVGGLNVPAAFGRFNATVPFAELVIDQRTLTLRARGIGRMVMTDFVVALDQVAAAFRLRGTVMTPGVGIQLRDGLVACFWTYTKQQAVLTALEERGVDIEPDARSGWGLTWGDGRESEAVLPTLPKLLQSLAPALALCATAIMILTIIIVEFWWMRPLIVLIWAISMVTTLGLWWKGRPNRAR